MPAGAARRRRSRLRALGRAATAAFVLATTGAAALPAGASAQVDAGAPCAIRLGRPWCDTGLTPDARAGLLLQAMTQQERIGLLGGDELLGVLGQAGTHTGTSNGILRLGVPTVHLTDGPAGVRSGSSTALPSPMLVAASFDPAAASADYGVLAAEAKAKGNDVVFGPGVNMLRTPLNGRTFEYLGEDPHLASRIAVAEIRRMQADGVIADVKHFAANNQEGVGDTPAEGSLAGSSTTGNRMTVDARVGERALRELYLPAFEAAVKDAGVLSVMCAYPRVNGTYACENGPLLTDVLRRDWGFKGQVLADYGATHSTAASLEAGLAFEPWPGINLGPLAVNAALGRGEVDQATIDQRVLETLRTLFAGGVFDRAPYPEDGAIDADAHDRTVGEVAERGMVLLRNTSAALPLDPAGTGRVAVIGPEADEVKGGGGSSATAALRPTSPLAGLQARYGADHVTSDDGSDAARAAEVARGADAAVVVVGDRAIEGVDKPCLSLNCGQSDGVDRDALVRAVAAANPRTIVVLETSGPVLMPWRDQVGAILEAWYPGQAGGRAIARLLAGDAEPSGRLPATFPVDEADEPTAGDTTRYPGVPDGTGIGEAATYSEGTLIGYRWFDAKAKPVAYPFGFGLGYTTFALSDERIEDGATVTVRATVTNTGARRGSTVPQAYVGLPAPAPGEEIAPWQLRGFEKVTLEPGASREVSFALDERALSSWSTAEHGWRIAPGCQRIAVGLSSRDLPLQGGVTRGEGSCPVPSGASAPGAAGPQAAAGAPATSASSSGAAARPAATRRCTSRRRFTITLARKLRRAQVRVDGRAVRVRRVRGRLRASIDLRPRTRSIVRVRIVGRTARGRVVRSTRTYRPCTARR